jgi:glycosyltransferase involved in cell wall biosynthesis
LAERNCSRSLAGAFPQGNDMRAAVSPKVSVCVLTYNHERYVRDCLQGIVDQKTNFPFEVIVGDDCSTDATQSIVREFASRYPEVVKPVLRPVNIGGTKNFLDTHNRAKGVYVAHIDGDDLMLPGKLQRQVEFLDANEEFSVVWHRVNLFDDEGGFVPGENYDLSFFPNGVITLEHALRLGAVGAHSSIMYRSENRRTVHADFEVLDLFYTWEYLSSGKGKMLDDVLGSYRVSAQGSIQLKSTVNVQKMIVHHARYYLNLMPHQRRNIFVLALIDFMVDAKNFRSTAWSFGKLAMKSASFVSPWMIVRTIAEMRRIPPCSPVGGLHIARLRKERRRQGRLGDGSRP